MMGSMEPQSMPSGSSLLRTVLLVAYHFPPIQGSSGVQRTLRFAQHLPKFGWRPIVLTITPRAYETVAVGKGNEIPPDLKVERAVGLDAARRILERICPTLAQAFVLPQTWSWRSCHAPTHIGPPRVRPLAQSKRIAAVKVARRL